MGLVLKTIMSEKSEMLKEKRGCYTFEVDRNINKIELKKEIEKEYNVEVEKINTFIKFEKTKTRNTKAGSFKGKKTVKKRAIVKLKEGNTLDILTEV